MAKCCPRTCSRLATAAAFIAIGIVQFIAGMLLLRSKYVYLLSGPNFWTAAANIAVGGLLGISAAIWKTINKKSTKYVSRRNVLSALVFSVIILNATTTAVLVVGEGNILLSIHLESNKIYNSTLLATEILGYAYAASVCSPIVAVVVAVGFLLGLCFQVKSYKSKKLNIESAVTDDTPDIYSWVYTPKLPKPNLSVMRMAVSSGSGSSSSDSDSPSSAEVPVLSHTPAYTTDRQYTRDKVSYLRETALHDPVGRRDCQSSSLRSSCSRSNKVSFADDSVLDTRTILNVPTSHGKFLYFSSGKNADAVPASAIYKAHKERLLTKKRSRVRPKILFKEYPSGEMLGHSDYEEMHMNISSKNPCNLTKYDTRLKRASNSDSFPRVHNSTNFSTGRKKSKEFPILHTEALRSSEISGDISQYHHKSLRRTSTTDDSKFIEAIASPEDSEICFDSVFITKGIHDNVSQEHVKNVPFEKDFNRNSVCGTNESPCPEEVVTVPVTDSDFRSILSAKLVPVPTPVVSNVHFNPKVPRRYSSSLTKEVHNKITNKRDGYSQPSFSSFRNEVKSKMKTEGALNELDAAKHHRRHSSVLKSPMDSISELPTEEINDQFLTSAHTSGYMSALDESDDSHELNSSKNRKSPTLTEHIDVSNKIKNKKSEYAKKFKSSDFRSLAVPHKSSVQKAIESFASENPDISVEDLVSHLLQAAV